MIDEDKKPLMTGEKIYLRKLVPSDKSQRYLSWLNDPEVQRYTQRRGRTLSMEDMERFLEFVNFSRDLHLAIVTKDNHLHIGNIALNRIDELNKNAELAIMIGDREYWNKGIGTEAIKLVTEYAFTKLNLHRLYTGANNIAFHRIMTKLNWTQEGVARQAFANGPVYEDYVRWSILKPEWEKQS